MESTEVSSAAECEDSGRALRKAAIAGDVNAIVRLLQAGVPVDAADSYGFTPLMLAAKRGHLAVVYHLLERGAVVTRVNHAGASALKYAATNGYETIVEVLLQVGANARESYGKYALIDYAVGASASDEATARIVRLLLQHGAEVRSPSGDTLDALSSAARYRRLAVVREFIAGGVRFQSRKDYESALTFSRLGNNPELRHFLESLEPPEG